MVVILLLIGAGCVGYTAGRLHEACRPGGTLHLEQLLRGKDPT